MTPLSSALLLLQFTWRWVEKAQIATSACTAPVLLARHEGRDIVDPYPRET
jgi:hypothetical protein